MGASGAGIGSTAAAAPAASASAALGGTATSAAIGLAALTASLAPAVAGVYSLGQAYDKEAQERKRKQLMELTRGSREQRSWLEQQVLKAKGWRAIGETGGMTLEQKAAQKGTGVTPKQIDALKAIGSVWMKGDASSQIRAQDMMRSLEYYRKKMKSRGGTMANVLGGEFGADLLQLGMSPEVIANLKEMVTLTKKQNEDLGMYSKAVPIVHVNIDGRAIAASVSTTKSDNNDRSGRPKKKRARSNARGS
jgi:hypothetical protein